MSLNIMNRRDFLFSLDFARPYMSRLVEHLDQRTAKRRLSIYYNYLMEFYCDMYSDRCPDVLYSISTFTVEYDGGLDYDWVEEIYVRVLDILDEQLPLEIHKSKGDSLLSCVMIYPKFNCFVLTLESKLPVLGDGLELFQRWVNNFKCEEECDIVNKLIIEYINHRRYN